MALFTSSNKIMNTKWWLIIFPTGSLFATAARAGALDMSTFASGFNMGHGGAGVVRTRAVHRRSRGRSSAEESDDEDAWWKNGGTRAASVSGRATASETEGNGSMVRSPSVQVEEKRRPNMSLVGMSRLKMGLHRAALHAKITVNEINYLKSHPSHFVWQERSYPFDFVRRGFCSPGDKRRERMSKDLMSGFSMSSNEDNFGGVTLYLPPNAVYAGDMVSTISSTMRSNSGQLRNAAAGSRVLVLDAGDTGSPAIVLRDEITGVVSPAMDREQALAEILSKDESVNVSLSSHRVLQFSDALGQTLDFTKLSTTAPSILMLKSHVGEAVLPRMVENTRNGVVAARPMLPEVSFQFKSAEGSATMQSPDNDSMNCNQEKLSSIFSVSHDDLKQWSNSKKAKKREKAETLIDDAWTQGSLDVFERHLMIAAWYLRKQWQAFVTRKAETSSDGEQKKVESSIPIFENNLYGLNKEELTFQDDIEQLWEAVVEDSVAGLEGVKCAGTSTKSSKGESDSLTWVAYVATQYATREALQEFWSKLRHEELGLEAVRVMRASKGQKEPFDSNKWDTVEIFESQLPKVYSQVYINGRVYREKEDDFNTPFSTSGAKKTDSGNQRPVSALPALGGSSSVVKLPALADVGDGKKTRGSTVSHKHAATSSRSSLTTPRPGSAPLSRGGANALSQTGASIAQSSSSTNLALPEQVKSPAATPSATPRKSRKSTKKLQIDYAENAPPKHVKSRFMEASNYEKGERRGSAENRIAIAHGDSDEKKEKDLHYGQAFH